MAFWKFGFSGFNNAAIDNLLEKENLTLDDVLNEEEILQECKTHNKKLIDYISKPENVRTLLKYVVSDDLEEPKRYKFPYVASEIYACEIWSLHEATVADKRLLEEFWSYLDRPPPLNPVTTGYFCKVNMMLLQKVTKEMYGFLTTSKNLVPKIIKHLGCASMVDLLLKLVSCDDPNYGINILDWLRSEGLVEKLFHQLDPNLDPELHSIASQSIVDLVAISHINATTNAESAVNNFNDSILCEIKSTPMIKLLVSFMLDPNASHSTSSLECGIDVLIELMRRSVLSSSQPNAPMSLKDVTDTALALQEYIPDFKKRLSHPKTPMVEVETTHGKIIPLGGERLKICELFAELLRLQDHSINLKMVEHQVLNSCLDLFFAYPWNNFLHSTVCDMLMNVYGGAPMASKEIIISTFQDAHITDRIVHAQKLNNCMVEKPHGSRLGYMGHVTIIVDEIMKLVESSVFKELLEMELKPLIEKEDWIEYVNKYYREIKNEDTKPLGGGRPEINVENDLFGSNGLNSTTEQLARYLSEKLTYDIPDMFLFQSEKDLALFNEMVNGTDFPQGDVDDVAEEEEIDNDNEEAEVLTLDDSDDDNSFDPESAVDDKSMDSNIMDQANITLSELKISPSDGSEKTSNNEGLVEWQADFSGFKDSFNNNNSDDMPNNPAEFEVDFSAFNNESSSDSALNSITPPPVMVGTPKPPPVMPPLDVLEGEAMPAAASSTLLPSQWNPSLLLDPLSNSPILSSSLQGHDNGPLERDINVSLQLTEATLERRNSLNVLSGSSSDDLKQRDSSIDQENND